MNKKKVAIIGATGFTGHELVQILSNHPCVDIDCVTSTTSAGEPLKQLYPDLVDCKLVLETYSPQLLVDKNIDIVFVALPHGAAMDVVAGIMEMGASIRIVDLSADFRLKDIGMYEKFYQPHRAPHLFGKSVFGLCEWFREDISRTQIVANPGCYVTSALLPLMPIKDVCENIIVDAKSGVSGAGKKVATTFMSVNVMSNFKPYGIASHRHQPEIETYLGKKIEFTPHLLPINRGILSTIYVNSDASYEELRLSLEKAYEKEAFVHVLEEGIVPEIQYVAGTNNCLMNIFKGTQKGRYILVSVLDNMIKGASGQAVQNFNIMNQIEETVALNLPAQYP